MQTARQHPLILMACLCALLILPACAGRKEAETVALDLAERLYPGALEVHGSQLQKNYYAVTLAVKGDPVTRIRLHMTSDLMDCAAGNPCEDSFRQAYETGLARGIELKSIDTAFRSCGLPALSAESYTDGPGLIPVIATPLTDASEANLIRRLTECAHLYATTLQENGRRPHQATLNLRLLRITGTPPPPPPEALGFHHTIPADLLTAPSYMLSFSYTDTAAEPGALIFSPLFRLRQQMAEQAAAAARHMQDAGDLTLPPQLFLTQMTRDPDRIGLVHAYLTACTPAAMQPNRPCQSPDAAIRISHDFDTGNVTAHDVLRHVGSRSGLPDLPPLPARNTAEPND